MGGLEAVQAGAGARAADDERWRQVFADHQAGLVRHLAYLLGDRAAAEDLAQEAFLRLVRRPPPRDGDLGAWLRVVGTRLAYNYLRGERRRRARELALAGDRALRAPAGGADDLGRLRGALDQLAARDRMVLLLRGSGASYADIAAALGISAGSVGTTLARATRRLRTAYAGFGQEGDDGHGTSR